MPFSSPRQKYVLSSRGALNPSVGTYSPLMGMWELFSSSVTAMSGLVTMHGMVVSSLLGTMPWSLFTNHTSGSEAETQAGLLKHIMVTRNHSKLNMPSPTCNKHSHLLGFASVPISALIDLSVPPAHIHQGKNTGVDAVLHNLIALTTILGVLLLKVGRFILLELPGCLPEAGACEG